MGTQLYYDVPVDEFSRMCSVKLPFEGRNIQTQLPKNIAVIRAIGIATLTTVVSIGLGSTVFGWSVAIAGTAFCGWTIYSHLCTKDPLVEAFYKICGGKNKFEQLPTINLYQAANEKLSDAVDKLKWASIPSGLSRTLTSDGRKVVIAKAIGGGQTNSRHQVKSIFAFVEKLGPNDRYCYIIGSKIKGTKFSDLYKSIDHAIFHPFTGNTFSENLFEQQLSVSTEDGKLNDNYHFTRSINSSISSTKANEFFAQVACR